MPGSMNVRFSNSQAVEELSFLLYQPLTEQLVAFAT
jgi:hypothetical protein